MKQNPWIILPEVPDEIYTDREDIIERLLKNAYEAIARRTP